MRTCVLLALQLLIVLTYVTAAMAHVTGLYPAIEFEHLFSAKFTVWAEECLTLFLEIIEFLITRTL